jgi:hypothetical protein
MSHNQFHSRILATLAPTETIASLAVLQPWNFKLNGQTLLVLMDHVRDPLHHLHAVAAPLQSVKSARSLFIKSKLKTRPRPSLIWLRFRRLSRMHEL